MRFDLSTVHLNLSPGVPLTIAEGAGTRIHVVTGRVWLTEEKQVDDVFLSAGMTYRLRGAGRIVVTAERVGEEPEAGAGIAIEAPVSVRSTRTLRAWFRSFWAHRGNVANGEWHSNACGAASGPTSKAAAY